MRTFFVTALLLMHGAAFAQGANQPALSYSFGELRYVDVDNGGDGFELGGSFQFNTSWFGVASFSSFDLDSNVDANSFEIGAGYIFPLQQDWDIQVNARFIRAEVDTPVGSVDDTGFGVLGGIRGGISHGSTDKWGYNVAENGVSVHDLHATMLHLLGMDHERLTYRFQGRRYRLTDVAGNVVDKIIA